ncbi:MAG: hypothetical protein C5B44_05750 [Acidobacteria bacterium]|nr:MAG: hypothetical protein C5B44_05750 [Acidobacteriota bacterium]
MKIEDVAAQKSGQRRLEYLQASVRVLERDRKRLWRELESRKEFLEQLRDAVTALDPIPPYKYQQPAKPTNPVVAVLKLSDWQIGEVISAKETEGFGRFNWAIAQQRMNTISTSFLRWVETQRHGYSIDECVLFAEGDFVSGDIHRELSVTNEFPLPVQAAKAGSLLAETVRMIAPNFKSVRLIEVGADNHGRLNPKPQFKQKTQNSMNYLVYEVANAMLEGYTSVSIERAEGIKHLVKVGAWKFLLEHGDTVKSWMGIPYYGIERETAREARRRMNTNLGFHYLSIGHWHVPALNSGNVIVNGSLTGTTEFDHGCGRHAAPAQVAFLVGKHGVFNLVPFMVE